MKENVSGCFFSEHSVCIYCCRDEVSDVSYLTVQQSSSVVISSQRWVNSFVFVSLRSPVMQQDVWTWRRQSWHRRHLSRRCHLLNRQRHWCQMSRPLLLWCQFIHRGHTTSQCRVLLTYSSSWRSCCSRPYLMTISQSCLQYSQQCCSCPVWTLRSCDMIHCLAEWFKRTLNQALFSLLVVFLHGCFGFCALLVTIVFSLWVFCTSQVIGWKDRLWNDL